MGRVGVPVSLAVCLTLGLVGCSDSGQADGSMLKNLSDVNGGCHFANANRTWADLKARATQFPMDDLAVEGPGPVEIESVKAVGMHGVRVLGVTFIPGDGVGGGFPYLDPKSVQFPAELAARRDMPGATLIPLTPKSDIVSGAWSKEPYWEALVAVLPTNSVGGGISSLSYTYRSNGTRHTIEGKVSLGLYPEESGCLPSHAGDD
jgi:hypothetical protein